MKENKIVIWIIIFASLTSFFYVDYIGTKFTPMITSYINKEVKRFTTNIVSTSVNDVIERYNSDELFIIKKTNNNEIEIVDLNTKIINKILKEINKTIKIKLEQLQNGSKENDEISKLLKTTKFKNIKNGIICEVTLNMLKNNVTLSNIGPTIPINLSFSGDVKTKTETKIKNYGINNLVIEVNILVEINEQITMPTSSKETTIKITAPLILKVIQGKVPNYYETDINGNTITSTIFSN